MGVISSASRATYICSNHTDTSKHSSYCSLSQSIHSGLIASSVQATHTQHSVPCSHLIQSLRSACMFLDCGRKHTWDEHANSTQKGPQSTQELNPRYSNCEITVLTTMSTQSLIPSPLFVSSFLMVSCMWITTLSPHPSNCLCGRHKRPPK